MYGKKLSEKHRKKISEAQTGKKHAEKTRKKMSKAQSGENHPMFGKKFSEEYRKKLSEAKNTTGYYHVCKRKTPACKQGFTYAYQYYGDDNKRHYITSVSLEKLEQKVKAKNLEWFKFDDNNGE